MLRGTPQRLLSCGWHGSPGCDQACWQRGIRRLLLASLNTPHDLPPWALGDLPRQCAGCHATATSTTPHQDPASCSTPTNCLLPGSSPPAGFDLAEGSAWRGRGAMIEPQPCQEGQRGSPPLPQRRRGWCWTIPLTADPSLGDGDPEQPRQYSGTAGSAEALATPRAYCICAFLRPGRCTRRGAVSWPAD